MNLISAILSLGFIGLIQTKNAETCAHTCVRKEIHQLTDAEWNAFLTAWHTLSFEEKAPLQSTDSVFATTPLTISGLAKIHAENMAAAHDSKVFLPFHRQQVLELEERLQAIDPSVCVPYWDFTLDACDLQKSITWDRVFATRDANGKLEGGCATGILSTEKYAYDAASLCIDRSFRSSFYQNIEVPTRNHVQDIFSNTEDILKKRKSGYNGETAYGYFERNIEFGVHNVIHDFVNGGMQHGWSPIDPVFYLLHSYIDKLWNDAESRFAVYGDDFLDFKVNLGKTPGYNTDLYIEADELCVVYQDYNINADFCGGGVEPPTATETGTAEPTSTEAPFTKDSTRPYLMPISIEYVVEMYGGMPQYKGRFNPQEAIDHAHEVEKAAIEKAALNGLDWRYIKIDFADYYAKLPADLIYKLTGIQVIDKQVQYQIKKGYTTPMPLPYPVSQFQPSNENMYRPSKCNNNHKRRRRRRVRMKF